jgi:predicted metal-binding membrane protein
MVRRADGFAERHVIGHSHASPSAGIPTLTLIWFGMMAAMMAPAVWPWIRAYHRFSGAAGSSTVLTAVPFAGGYFAAWLAYSIAAAFLQRLAADRLALDTSIAGSIALIAAGAYQFTTLKASCLTHCRNPLTYFLTRWRSGPAGGFAMGAHHGWFCVGCCWALMATMLAVGVTSVWWMMALTVATFVEQTVANGDAVRLPIGVALIGAGLLSMSRLA